MITLSRRDITAEQNDKLEKLKKLIEDFGGIQEVKSAVKTVMGKGGFQNVMNLLRKKESTASLYTEAGFLGRVKKLINILLLAGTIWGVTGQQALANPNDVVDEMFLALTQQTQEEVQEDVQEPIPDTGVVDKVFGVIETKLNNFINVLVEKDLKGTRAYTVSLQKVNVEIVDAAMDKFFNEMAPQIRDKGIMVRQDRIIEVSPGKFHVTFNVKIPWK
jgi:hypothetical protein